MTAFGVKAMCWLSFETKINVTSKKLFIFSNKAGHPLLLFESTATCQGLFLFLFSI
jgi:hypothetical protein